MSLLARFNALEGEAVGLVVALGLVALGLVGLALTTVSFWGAGATPPCTLLKVLAGTEGFWTRTNGLFKMDLEAGRLGGRGLRIMGGSLACTGTGCIVASTICAMDSAATPDATPLAVGSATGTLSPVGMLVPVKLDIIFKITVGLKVGIIGKVSGKPQNENSNEVHVLYSYNTVTILCSQLLGGYRPF